MDKFKKAASIIEKISVHNTRKNCEELFCKLHDEDYLGFSVKPKKGINHNCLACQLNDGNQRIHKFLKQTDSSSDNEYNFTIYILLLYLQVEKLHTIFKIIGLTFEYVELNWKVLIEIRKWANFIKHPKGFLFTHHPSFLFEDAKYHEDDHTKILDYKFVSKFYYRENEEILKQSIQELGNKSNILVILPSPDRLASEYVKVCTEFCDKIKDNPHFREILKTRSSLNDLIL